MKRSVHKFRLYLAGIALLVGSSLMWPTFALADNSNWTPPVEPIMDQSGSEIQSGGLYYIKNVAAGQFLTGANSWSTQISLTSAGINDTNYPPLIIQVVDTTAVMSGNSVSGYAMKVYGSQTVNGNDGSRIITNTLLFRDSESSGFIDYNNQGRGFVWNITKDNGFYRIRTADGDSYFGDIAYQYAGWHDWNGPIEVDESGNLISGETVVYFNCWYDQETGEIEDNTYIDWLFIPVGDYIEKMKIYDARLGLYNQLIEAESQGISTNAAGAVYSNDAATLDEIVKATENLKADVRRKIYETEWANATEENPLEITEYCLQNADFSAGNINGWICTFISGSTANNVGYQSASYTNQGDSLTGSAYNEEGELSNLYQFIEAWSNSSFNNGVVGNGELYQKVYGLPTGIYSLSCDAIAVDQYKGNNPVSGVEIFISTESGIESSQAIATGNGSPEHFTVKFISDGSPVVSFGLRTRNANANWIAADNFRIFFYGKATSIGAIQLKNTIEVCAIEEVGPCKADVKAAYENALNTSNDIVSDENISSDSCLVQADILKATYRALLASIEDYKPVPAIMTEFNSTLETIKGLNNESLTEQATAFIQAFSEKYTSGTLEAAEISSAKQDFKAIISAAITTSMEAGDDLTLLITNPTFDTNGEGWNMEGYAQVNYNHGTAEVYHNAFDYYQVIPSAAAGIYRLSCTAFNRVDGNVRTAKLYGGISEVLLKLITEEGSTYALLSDVQETGADGTMYPSTTGTWPYDVKSTAVAGAEGQTRFVPNSMEGANTYFITINPATEIPYYTVSTQIVLPEKGDLRIGIKSESNSEWTIWDNFKLEYVGSYDDLLTDYTALLKAYLGSDVYYNATLRQEATSIVASAEAGTLSEKEAYNIIGRIGNLIDEIKISIAAYTSLNEAIVNTEELMTTTTDLDEAVAAELQTLLNAAKAAYAAGSYSNDEAKAAATEINSLSRRLQSGFLIIELEKAGTLGDIVLDLVENFSDVKGIYITGPLNSDDMANIARMTAIKDLDLTNVQLTRIEDEQFRNNDSLQIVHLPKTLTYLGYGAFMNCESLKSITIPGNISSMGSNIFYSCDNLEEVIIEEGITTISYGMFQNCYRLSKLTLPLSLTTIREDAFQNCYSLANIPLPGKLQTIGNEAFYRDQAGDYYKQRYLGYDNNGNYLGYAYDTIPNLSPKHLEIPASVTEIGEYAFYNMSGLESVTLNEGLASLGDNAFYGTKVTTATFPSTLTSVGDDVFNSGTHYTSLSLTPPTADNGSPVAQPDTLYVPQLVVKAYKQASGWDKFKIVGTDEMPGNIVVRKQMNLDFANATLPEGYKPNVNIMWTDINQTDTGTPTQLGALEVHNSGTFSVGYLEMNYSNAQANYMHSDQEYFTQPYYTPQFSTLITDGSMRADNILIRVHINDGNWSFISLPYDVRVGDVTCETAGTNWIIRRYDGEARAAVDLNNTWVNMDADDILEAGKGYIIHCSYSNDWWNDYRVFHFPALNNQNKNLIFSAANRTIELAEYQSEYAHNRSWNLIGNPYPAYIEIGSTDFEAPITVWNGYNGYDAYSPLDDDYVLTPGEAFFVQRPLNKSSITFKADGRKSYYDVTGYTNNVKAIRQENSERRVFNLLLSDGEHSDRTRVVINPAAAMDYETERDAAKFAAMDATATQLYSVAASVQYAINERPLADGSVQLAARFGKAGTYTFTLSTKVTESVILIDELEGTAVELNGTEGYTFTAEAGTADKRFRLQIAGTADAINQLAADDLRGADIFTLDGKKLAGKPAVSGVYLLKKNGTVRKVSVK